MLRDKNILYRYKIFTLSFFLQIKLNRDEVTNFFLGAVNETIDYREKNNVKRNDFMQLLIQLKNKGYLEDVDSPTESMYCILCI